MNVHEIARGGLLAAAAAVLLYIGGVMPHIGVCCCVAAGVFSAAPLLRRGRVKTALLLYAAASVIAGLIVPRKGLVLVYVVFCGLYPIIKYGIECRVPRHAQRFIKLCYFNLCLLAAYFLLRAGFFPTFALPGVWRRLILWFVANVIFEMYDIGLSRLIAAMRRTLPPD